MTSTPDLTEYNFEAQLELGELLLDLGRIEEACVELEKAQQLLNIAPAHSSNGDMRGQESVQRLDDAMSRAQEMSVGDRRARQLTWLAIIGALAAGLLIVFTLWFLNQENLEQAAAASTVAFAEIEAQETALADTVARAGVENTRSVREIIDQRNAIATISAENTRFAGIAGGRDQLATAEAIATQAAGTVTAVFVNQATATPSPLPSQTPRHTPTPSVPIWDRLQILYDGVVLRSGPSRNFRITSFLNREDIVDILAQDGSAEWFNVQTNDGVRGWVHTSVVRPLAVNNIPIAETIPPPPPTLTPTPTFDPFASPTPTFTIEPAPTEEITDS